MQSRNNDQRTEALYVAVAQARSLLQKLPNVPRHRIKIFRRIFVCMLRSIALPKLAEPSRKYGLRHCRRLQTVPSHSAYLFDAFSFSQLGILLMRCMLHVAFAVIFPRISEAVFFLIRSVLVGPFSQRTVSKKKINVTSWAVGFDDVSTPPESPKFRDYRLLIMGIAVLPEGRVIHVTRGEVRD